MKMFPKRVWVGFFILIILYSLIEQEYEGLKYLLNASQPVKHIVNFSFLVIFSLIGYYSWSTTKGPLKWILKIWIIFYCLAFLITGAGGIIDLLFRIHNMSARNFFRGVRQFFTSPLPFGICMLLGKLKYTFHANLSKKALPE